MTSLTTRILPQSSSIMKQVDGKGIGVIALSAIPAGTDQPKLLDPRLSIINLPPEAISPSSMNLKTPQRRPPPPGASSPVHWQQSPAAAGCAAEGRCYSCISSLFLIRSVPRFLRCRSCAI